MRLLIRAALALTLVFAACGGDDEPAPQGQRAATDAAGRAAGAPEPDGATATTDEGEIVASNGFDASRDGFAFKNYGRNRGPMMRAQEIRELFGDVVCVDPAAATCVLIPVAERWRQQQNEQWVLGHCYGFSTLSLSIFRGITKASLYGAPTTHELRIATADHDVTNPELAADLARDAATQTLASVQRKARRYTPKEAVEQLIRAFQTGDDNYILSFFMPGEGGHATVPVAVIDRGHGIYEIQMYDNNFPYHAGAPAVSDRRMRIDTGDDSWEYTISIRPDVPEDRWHGQGHENMLELQRSESQARPAPCPFCEGPAGANARTTVSLGGDPALHGHLRITDADGHVTGYDEGRLVNQIPGADVIEAQVIRRELIEPEPLYRLPESGSYEIEVVDVPLGAPAHTVHATGPALGVGLSGLVRSGATLRLASGGVVGVDDAVRGPARLSVAVEGDREVRLEPASDRVVLRPTRGDTVRIRGRVKSAVVLDPASGRRVGIPGGSFDLSELVGSARSS